MLELIKKITPQFVKQYYHKREQRLNAMLVAKLPKLDELLLEKILREELSLQSGDCVMVHSSVNQLNLTFPSYNILKIVLDIIGNNGTLIMPTYPKQNSYKFLSTNQVFNIRKTPTYTGLMNEYARRHKDARRSLHPTKSVVAIGKNADIIVSEHNNSIYPYSEFSPYYKINSFDTKIIGIGIETTYLSAVHSVEDTLLERFPVDPYHNEIFNAKCIDYDGNEVIVRTKAHDMRKMHFDLPKFFKHYVTADVCKDIDLTGMKFFLASAPKLYSNLCGLAAEGVTIYSRNFYRR